MSFRELSMIEIREVLRRWTAGQAVRAVARETGVDRKTVDRYVNAARESGMERGSELSDAIVTAVSQRVQGRPLPASSEQWKQLEAQRARIEQWLKSDRPLRLVRVHELLGRDGVLVSYTTLRRFAHREIGWHERALEWDARPERKRKTVMLIRAFDLHDNGSWESGATWLADRGVKIHGAFVGRVVPLLNEG